MSVLWKVKLLELNEEKFTKHIKNVYDDIGSVPAKPMFMLQLLYDACIQGAFGGDVAFPKGTLTEEISSNDSWDNDFMEKVAPKYISAVRNISHQTESDIEGIVSDYLKNKLDLDEDSDEWEDAYEEEKDKLSIEATYEIEMADKKYIDHLSHIMYRKNLFSRPVWDSWATY